MINVGVKGILVYLVEKGSMMNVGKHIFHAWMMAWDAESNQLKNWLSG